MSDKPQFKGACGINDKCECEHSACQHTKEERGCKNPAIALYYFEGSGTFALCLYCLKEYERSYQ